jgi:hypothetical protein
MHRMTIRGLVITVAITGLLLAGWSWCLLEPYEERDLDWFTTVLFMTCFSVLYINFLILNLAIKIDRRPPKGWRKGYASRSAIGPPLDLT